MKKNYFFLIVFLIMCSISAQDTAKTLTIEANEFTTVTLFFPLSIDKVIPPASNYKFEMDQGKMLGTLKARKGPASNMTVITTDGKIFSILVNYSEKLDKYNYIINENQALGSKIPKAVENPITQTPSGDKIMPPKVTTTPGPIESPITTLVNTAPDKIDPIPDVSNSLLNKPKEDPIEYANSESDLYNSDREEYYRIFCENNYLQKSILKRSFRQNKKIIVRLNNILVDRDEIYFMLSLENTSKKDYNVNDLSFFIKESQRDNNPLILEPVHTFNLQKIIDRESDNEIVYVFKKFSLETNQILEIVLDEIDSSRFVLLPLDYKYLNLLSK
ncbi:hypothetical protein Celal_3756 [Cellulophaga algicola DSM 14237]|uniref:DUF4138 domain-containing protein n=1 Tax=Cellulophaga algicola (strain DSM 14237 / IC166 / ACAM 630) TaxID=688270 RepID=E6XAP3_CELAD|nr:DUF4138 domain-containing protein [Cellulophaga algicola]ADV51005.1 hypothetical protein Celal_3756 [Cellulophaga algicola DSM 14237]